MMLANFMGKSPLVEAVGAEPADPAKVIISP
jgi:hypothetical protein